VASGGLGGAEDGVLRRWLLSSATGVAAAAVDAGVDGTDRHRRSQPAKQPCGALDKKEEQ
jgi:hypothetical protein